MKMNQEPNELQSFTVEEFQADFDNLMNRVENGECFIIKNGRRSAVIVPFKETIKYALDSLKPSVDDELIRLHTNHEEGS